LTGSSGPVPGPGNLSAGVDKVLLDVQNLSVDVNKVLLDVPNLSIDVNKREFDERLNEERQSPFILEAPDGRLMGQKTIRR
jgi:hypothetical protein